MKEQNEKIKEKQKVKKCKWKGKKGITLIALVVTIIVLLLLAGISISMLTGEGGILNRATQAKVKTVHQTVYEQLKMQGIEYTMSRKNGEYDKGLMEYLEEKGYVEKQTEKVYLVKLENLMGKQSMGNGKDGETDVYKLEQIGEEGEAQTIALEVEEKKQGKVEYELKYYGKNANENENIGKLIDSVEGVKSGEEEIESIDYYVLYSDDMPLNPNESTLRLNLIYIDEIKAKCIPGLPKTEEELYLKSYNEYRKSQGWEEFETFEEMVEEAKKEGGLEGEYNTAKELYMSDYENEYNQFIEELQSQYPEIEKEEELLLKTTNEYRKSQGLEELATFEEMVEDFKKEEGLKGEYNTAKELYMAEFGYENEYNQFIEELREEYYYTPLQEQLVNIEIYNPEGKKIEEDRYGTEEISYYEIKGPGEYIYTVKMPNKKECQFKVVIDRYEIIMARKSIDDVMQISSLPPPWCYVYDFSNNKIMFINSGTLDGEPLSSDKIVTRENVGSGIKCPNSLFYGRYNLLCDGVYVEGYASVDEIPY